MPGFDGTGPAGMGSMTGRGMGFCAMPVSQTSNVQPQVPVYRPTPPVAQYTRPRFFPGRGRGGGRGFRGGRRGRGRW